MNFIIALTLTPGARSKSLNPLSVTSKTARLVTIFLVNGIKLEGIITSFDTSTVTLRGSNNTQLVYKHAISTILPV